MRPSLARTAPRSGPRPSVRPTMRASQRPRNKAGLEDARRSASESGVEDGSGRRSLARSRQSMIRVAAIGRVKGALSVDRPGGARGLAPRCPKHRRSVWASAERAHLDRDGEPLKPSRSTCLFSPTMKTRRRAAAGDDLLAEQAPPAPLDHPEGVVDLVGAVEVEVERVDGIEVDQRRSRTSGRARPWPRSWGRPKNAQPLLGDPLAETLGSSALEVVPEPSPTAMPS